MKYKWKHPENNLEETERFTLIEDRGDRVLVSSNYTESDLAIVPTYCLRKCLLIEAF